MYERGVFVYFVHVLLIMLVIQYSCYIQQVWAISRTLCDRRLFPGGRT